MRRHEVNLPQIRLITVPANVEQVLVKVAGMHVTIDTEVLDEVYPVARCLAERAPAG